MFDVSARTIPYDAITGIQNAGATAPGKCCPFDATLLGVVIGFASALSTSGGVDMTFDILIDGVDSGVDLTIADGSTFGLFRLTQELAVPAGAVISFQSNGEQSGANEAYISAAVKPG